MPSGGAAAAGGGGAMGVPVCEVVAAADDFDADPCDVLALVQVCVYIGVGG